MTQTARDHVSRAFAFLRTAMLWLVAACLLQSIGAAAQTPFQDPAGRFTLTIPKGWTVANREPLVVTARDASVTVTTADGTDADAAVQGLLGQVEGQWSRWQELKRGTTSIGGQRAPLVFASGNNPKGVPAFFRISAAPAGNAVLVMMASVPQDRFADARPGIEAMGGEHRDRWPPAPRRGAAAAHARCRSGQASRGARQGAGGRGAHPGGIRREEARDRRAGRGRHAAAIT